METKAQDSWANPLVRAATYGGVVSGVLDATDGVVAFGIQGLNPIQVLQYIASGAVGDSAFHGGLVSAAAGAGFHFLISFVAAGVFAVAAARIQALRRHWVIAGLAYGVWVWAFMKLGVLPLSAVKPAPFSIAMTLNGLIGHALLVGLPIAWFSKSLGTADVKNAVSE